MSIPILCAYTASNASAGYASADLKYQEKPYVYLTYHFTKKGNCIIDYIKYNA